MYLIKGQYVLVWYFSLYALFNILFFSINSDVFYEIFYNDVTTLLWRHSFLTDFNENCKAYVKMNYKIFLFVELFWFSEYLLRKLVFIKKIPSIVQLPYTSPHPLWAAQLGWVLLGTHLSHTWGYFFNTQKKCFYQKWWKPGSIPIFGPPLGGGGGVLVLVAP